VCYVSFVVAPWEFTEPEKTTWHVFNGLACRVRILKARAVMKTRLRAWVTAVALLGIVSGNGGPLATAANEGDVVRTGMLRPASVTGSSAGISEISADWDIILGGWPTNYPNARWDLRLEYGGPEPRYTLQSKEKDKGGYLVAMSRNGDGAGAKVIASRNLKSGAQLWYVEEKDGKYRFRCANGTGLVLEAAAQNGVVLTVKPAQPPGADAAQWWVFEH
jgi:hypothetical protein